MKTIDTCGQKLYSPLIPAVKAMCEATLGEKLEIIMNDTAAFNDLKEYQTDGARIAVCSTNPNFDENILDMTDIYKREMIVELKD